MGLVINGDNGGYAPQGEPKPTGSPQPDSLIDESVFAGFSQEGKDFALRAQREDLDSSFAELFFSNGFMNGNFDEISKYAGTWDGVHATVVDNGSGRYVELDLDGDGRYDQRAEYDENGRKTEEAIDSNMDGKLDTIIAYDEEGNATSMLVDEDYDGCIDFSESASDDE